MSGPFAIPVRIGLPFRGLCAGGAIALPNGTAQASPQPEGGGTVIVSSPTPPADTRSAYERALDTATGKQWPAYAHLSGVGKMLGGQEIDPSAKGGGWLTRNSGQWLYNDGATTWLMKWTITPDRRTSTFSDWHTLSITIEKPFGLFGIGSEGPWTARELLSIQFVDGPEDYYHASRPEIYLAFHSQDGSKSVFNMGYEINYGCDSSFADWLAIHPWTRLLSSGDGRWLAYTWSSYSYLELTISGQGQREPGQLGDGITVDLVTRTYFDQFDDDGDSYNELSEQFRTVSPGGEFSSWFMDDVALKVKCGAIDETGHFVQALGPAPDELPRIADFTVDSCYDTLSTTAPNVGVKLLDNCFLQAKEGTADWTMLHLQAGPPETNGVSYDIGNDEWSTTAGSCYV